MNMKLNSNFKSKINITQIIGLIAMVLAMKGIELSAEQQAALVTVIGMIIPAITFVWSWFYTPAAKGTIGLRAIDLTQIGSMATVLTLFTDLFGSSAADEKVGFIAAPVIGTQIITLMLRVFLSKLR